MAKNDGGSAFPVARSHFKQDGRIDSTDYQPGMSLRDYLAAKANDNDITEHRESWKSDSGKWVFTRSREAARYHFADAMLAEREKEPAE